MKTVANTFKNADALLRELLAFEGVAMDMWRECAPYHKAGNGRTLPRFITDTSVALKGLLVGDFSRAYPDIHYVVENGDGGTDASFGRLPEALYTFDAVQKEINGKNCVLMDDKTREAISEKLALVVGDIVVFTAVQFGLHRIEVGEVMLAVQSHCERVSISADVFYGLLLQDMKEVGQSWYAYEALSPYCAAINEFDPVFVAECEENLFPLSDSMAASLLNGEVDLVYARTVMNEYTKGSEEHDVDVTPSTLLSKMKLRSDK